MLVAIKEQTEKNKKTEEHYQSTMKDLEAKFVLDR